MKLQVFCYLIGNILIQVVQGTNSGDLHGHSMGNATIIKFY